MYIDYVYMYRIHLLLGTLRKRNGLDEGGIIWIYAVDQRIAYHIVVFVNGEIDGRRSVVSKFLEQRRVIQNINVIVCSRHAKKSMPDVKVLRGDGYEDERGLPFLASVLASAWS